MSHEKRHLPRAVELEKRRYIGFARQPVVDKAKVFPSEVKASGSDPKQAYDPDWGRRPYFDSGGK